MTSRPSGHTSVMQQRHHAPPNELDFFPTPPWATRAVLPILQDLDPLFNARRVWEPACGGGHMAAVLAEGARRVVATDIFDHGWRPDGGARGNIETLYDVDFLNQGVAGADADWVITNPPFKTAVEFAFRALALARQGVALLVRTAWLEGGDRSGRYELFSANPPRLIVQYAERVPMTRGRWDPKASTATAYCWVIWRQERVERTEFRWIAPGQREAMSRPQDLAFAVQADAPLFEGGPR